MWARAMWALVGLCLSAAAAAQTSSGPTASGAAGQGAPLLRYPTVHDDTVVFEAGGNLWKSALSGGTAVQLTADAGFDSDAHFSPNGRWVAFTGGYQGNTDVYVVPAGGGAVRRLTYHSVNSPADDGKLKPVPDNRVVGWTPDSKRVVFLSRRDSFNPQILHAYSVPVTGGLPKKLPIPWTGPLSFGPNAHTIAYNKLARSYRSFHRKHYYGGQAQDIWTFDFATGKSHRITHWKGADVWPMWSGHTIYFTSDRGPAHVQNLWAYSQKTGDFRQLTYFSTYDIDFPTLGGHRIVFSDGGDLYVYDTKTGLLHELDVRVPLDGRRSLPHWAHAKGHVDSASVAPNGHLAVFSARGALFTVPAEYGSAHTLTHAASADDRDPAWSPDGKQIAYIRAEGDRQTVEVRPADGGPSRALTHDGNTSFNGPITWSPDSRWITYVDSNQTLWLENVASGKRQRVATDHSAVAETFDDVHWSPGGQWLAFSKAIPERMGRMTVPNLHALYLYNRTDHRLARLGSGRFDDSEPVFSDDGKYLFFASNRLVNAAVSNFDEVVAGLKSSGLYAVTLRKGTPSPVAPRVRSATGSGGKKSAASGDTAGAASGPSTADGSSGAPKPGAGSAGKSHQPIRIDTAGLLQRAVRLPVPDADIQSIAESNGVVFYTTGPSQTLAGPLAGQQAELRAYDLHKRADHTLATGVSDVQLSADGSTLLFRQSGQWMTRPASFAVDAGDGATHTLDLAGLKRRVHPRAEWKTAYGEATRDVRDYFLNPRLIHAIWPKIAARYRRLLPRAASRQDVNWLIGNAIGSTGESHMYITGGDRDWRTPANPTADLGAEYALDSASGRYRIKRIYRGDNTLPGYRAPLNQPGLKVKAGDYLLAVDGQPLEAPMNPYALLQGAYGGTVSLKVARDAKGDGAHVIHVKPVANAHKLHLLAWIRHNRKTVARLSHGRVGYVYLEDMEATGMNEFVRQYYAQRNKAGIIFDDRWNLGGFIDPILFDRLARPLAGMFTNRYRATSPTPNTPMGHMAALINHGSASDGDIFAYMFKKDGLGPTIGTRTWGGVRGYTTTFSLLGGGRLVVSDNGMYGTDGRWIIENIGVSPDINVADTPGALNAGHDAQLERAVNVLMERIRKHPKRYPQPPDWLPAFPPQPAYPSCASPSVGDGACDWAGNS